MSDITDKPKSAYNSEHICLNEQGSHIKVTIDFSTSIIPISIAFPVSCIFIYHNVNDSSNSFPSIMNIYHEL